ncbi:MAG: exo-alpha-sialidase [Planctomycetes bacterium]|nr:exo-alpha-sialidase [Planctomycetota bacterium]
MRLAVLLLAVLLGSAIPCSALADIIHVPADYPTIQAAIYAAASGDEIIVAPGVYNEALYISGIEITLRSSEGPEVTVIDGSAEKFVVMRLMSVGPGTLIDGFTITGGQGYYEAGGLQNLWSSPTISNCMFVNNTSDTYDGDGGAIYNAGDALTIVNCSFYGNIGAFGAGIYNAVGSVTVTGCRFEGNRARSGGGVWNRGDMTMIDCLFEDNAALGFLAAQGSGRPVNEPGSEMVALPGIRTISSTFGLGGGVVNSSFSVLLLVNCSFEGNTAFLAGGGIFSRGNLGQTTVINCTLTGNSAESGGGIRGSGLSNVLTVANSILWGNTPDQLSASNGLATLSYSDIQGGWSGEGSNNIDADPLFTSDASGELRPGPGSPCIDAGDSTAVPPEITTDLLGHPRMADDPATEDTGFDKPPIVDMGAYEYGSADCNNNGLPDAEDLFNGTSLDCDQNGIPDECDPDCNENDVPDACDIADGTSLNCNNDFIPDECEPDCNENMQADSCDITDGISWDCNRNGIPDECDVASGESEDCNENGIPDECEVVGLDPADSRPINTNAPFESGWDTSAQVSTDAQGNWVAVWESTDDLGGTIGPDSDIVVSRSTNNGGSWTSPEPLNTYAATDASSDRYPILGTDGAGMWLVAWQSVYDLEGTIGEDRDILFSRSTDNGITWSDPAPVNSNAGSDSGLDYDPELATDGAGNWVIVWRSDDDLDGTIGNDLDILYSRSTDNGATWSVVQPLNINANSDGAYADRQPQVTTDNAGNWVAVWRSQSDLNGTIGNDADILFCRSTDNGASWSYPAALNTNAADDSGWESWPELATDGAGQWVAVWESSDSFGGTIGNDTDILFSRSWDAGATWTDPIPLNTNAADDSEYDGVPHLTTDGMGHWVASWQSEDTLDYTIGDDFDILFAYSTDEGANWTDPEPLNTNAASDVGNDYEIQISTDGMGNWIGVWSSSELLEGEVEIDFDILFTRFRLTAMDCSGNGIPDECEPDCNENGEPDSCDTFDGTSEDCNENEVPDECEIANGDAVDCNDNGIPDECEADCNGNGQADECDVVEGSSGDCNSNNVPDECEVDCNANGQPDECDIADGTSEDCNMNGVPDECPGESTHPTITQQPLSQEVEAGEVAVFSIQVEEELVAYVWHKDGVALIGSERIIGTGTSTLSILDVVPSDAGEYDCVVWDPYGHCMTSDEATLTVHDPCPWDIDGDGEVGPFDLALVLGFWGPCDGCDMDLDGDGEVGPFDLALVLGNWGPCP